MKVGQKIICKLYPEYEEGIIISKQNVFGKLYYKIFFENVNKIIEIPKDDIKPIDNPLDLFKSQIFSKPIHFKLKFLAHLLDVIASGEEMISLSNFKINPLPHQLLVLDFVLNQFKPRCLLADEVGLGKTIEAALIMEELKLRNIIKRMLIITPAGLTTQWKDELKIKFSEDFLVINGATFKSFKEIYGEETNIWLNFNKVITSIDFLKPKKINDDLSETEKKRREIHNKSVFEDCINANWDIVIIDEAHKLTKHESGEETARYKIGKRLSDSVPIFLILTATPHKGKPHIFKNLLSLVDPYLFNKLEDLKPENVKQISIRNKKRATIDFSGNKLFKNRITTLCEITWDSEIDEPEISLYNKVVEYISEYYNFALKENNHLMILLLMLYQRIVSSSSRAILKSLQNRLNTLEKIYKLAQKIKEISFDSFTELSGEEQLDFINNLFPVLKNPELVKKEISIVSECITLARNATIGRNDAKLRKLINIIDDLKRSENDKDIKILIFTEFKETQRYIIESLENLGYKTTYINGDLNLEQKILHKQKFQEDTQILISTDAGGEGINLQFCYIVINYDLPWNPMKIEQRIGRVDRIGQRKDVIAFNFILTDTIEEYVREKIEEKLKLVKIQYGDDKLSDILTSLNEEFQFDKIFLDYISRNIQNSDELDKISNQIYQRAKEILENDDLLIPFSDLKNIKDFKIDNIQRLPRKIHLFLSLFLKERKLELREYKNNNDVFFFKNDFRTDIFSSYYKKVIFNQIKGIDNEDAELISLNHKFVKEMINYSKNFGKISRFIVEEDKFKATNGFLFIWIFSITNNKDLNRKYVIPVFIEGSERYNRRISEYLINNIENIDLKEFKSSENIDIDTFYHLADEEVKLIAESTYLEVQKEWNDKIISDKEKLEKYYLQKAKAIAQIKIENIKLSKQKELRKEKHEKILDLKKQSNLFPHLDCIQIAKINFR